MEALYYYKIDDDKIKCELCPHNCIIKKNESGICKVRVNQTGKLISQNYGLVSSIGFDPIEKKPLYHFYPGSEILSIGSLGCNLQCEFCQNWQISQCSVEEFKSDKFINSNEIIDLALSKEKNIGIAYTYNEPTVFFEFMLDVAKKAKQNKFKNVMVTNGFINQRPLNELNNFIDAYSVDLKAFNNKFFIKYTKSQLEPVKETLKNIVKAGKHLEITNLVIPGLNDNPEEFEQMIIWISENLGKDIVLHISKYYPTYKLKIEPTSIETMLELNNIANKYLNHVFLGNVLLSDGNNTHCPKCNEIIISRTGYLTQKQSVNSDGDCINCGTHVLNYLNWEK
ncbi:MAG: AmmeMemoRadiSam system radical SAM enzyme [Bacteroidales bacterium]|jgi:pyruvate formate lyase activating enzyme|nr:AmmeMemoRadiSam system radical SAM enzyme [Bacteroidales bacterium]